MLPPAQHQEAFGRRGESASAPLFQPIIAGHSQVVHTRFPYLGVKTVPISAYFSL